MKTISMALCGAILLMGCMGSTVDPNQLNVDLKDGIATGQFGSAWTPNELKADPFFICGDNAKISDLVVTPNEEGGGSFTAKCLKG